MSVSPPEPDGAPGQGLNRHFHAVCRGFEHGQLTLVLGAGASLFGRASSEDWTGAPSSTEIAAHLATEFGFEGHPGDLLRVAQWAYVTSGWQPLYGELHRMFEPRFAPTQLHEDIAGLAGRFEARHRQLRHPLIVTTNYDDLIEQAFVAAGEEFDLVAYSADGPYRGHFLHRPPDDGEFKVIEDPQRCVEEVDPRKRAVILKLHGFVDRENGGENDSYVITEDHYIEYLTHKVDEFLPPNIVTRLKRSHLLFLGYSLRDWNLRAMIHALRIDKSQFTWWAVLLNPDVLERSSWAMRHVDIIDLPLEDYRPQLSRYVEEYLSRPS